MLSIITINEIIKWEDTVKSFKKYDMNYLSGYVKAFEFHGDGKPLLIYYNDGNTRAINVIMVRDIANVECFKNKLEKNVWFDISTPYGYGGFCIEGDDYDAVNNSYQKFCADQGYICEFVRFHLLNNYQKHFIGQCETHTHNIIRSLDLPLDEMFMDFEHKVRKNINKANKSKLGIEIDSKGERLDEFLEIYYETMNRAGANKAFFFTKEFFEILNKMENNYIYMHVLYEGKVISTELVLYGPENCYSFLGGTNQAYFNLRPNDFLKYEIIKWAKGKGLKRFILGGGYGDDDGIYKYKKSLSPNGVHDFYIGKNIYNIEKYNKLISIKKSDYGIDDFIDINDLSSFFPIYRADFVDIKNSIINKGANV